MKVPLRERQDKLTPGSLQHTNEYLSVWLCSLFLPPYTRLTIIKQAMKDKTIIKGGKGAETRTTELAMEGLASMNYLGSVCSGANFTSS